VRFGVETLAAPDDRLAEVVFDATDNPQAMEASFERVAPGTSGTSQANRLLSQA
jgi:hypothetical protein